MKWIFNISIIFCLLALSNLGYSAGFRISLYDGKFYGPGNLGMSDIHDGSLENFIVTAPMTGIIPFSNNGSAEPNVTAENNHTGPIDGLLSDGTKINENVNAAFVLQIKEPETQQPVKLLVCSVSEEIVKPDEKDNLTFNLHAAFDSGFAQDAVQLYVQFITGAVEVPLSEKTKRGLKGGHDHAGPMPAGTVYVGRLGDMDQDGFMDGVFALAGNTPYELLIAEGDPVLIVRPFKSDIPINPKEASYYELNGVVRNFLGPIQNSIASKRYDNSISYIEDVKSRIEAVLENIKRVRTKKTKSASNEKWHTVIKPKLMVSMGKIDNAILNLKNKYDKSITEIESAFSIMWEAHKDMKSLLNKKS